MRNVLIFAVPMTVAVLCSCSGGEKVKSEPGAAGTPTATAKYRLEVVLDGPWSFVKDPAHNRIVAVAPVITGHSSLYVRATGSKFENPGTYDLALSGASSDQLTPAYPAPRFVPEGGDAIPASQLAMLEQAATADKYVVNLPATDSIQAVYNDELAYSTAYSVPVPSSATNYVTKVAFHYLVDSLRVELNGTSNDGTTTSGVKHSFTSEGTLEAGIDAPLDRSNCDDGAKGTFLAMTSLVQKKLFVDYPGYLVSCQNSDPQNPRHSGKPFTEMNHEGSEAIKNDVLGAIEKARQYADYLEKQTESKDPGKRVLVGLAKIEAGVKGWKGEGPTNTERARFVSGLEDLTELVGSVELQDAYRERLRVLIADVGARSISGKNCKAPLMLFTVGP